MIRQQFWSLARRAKKEGNMSRALELYKHAAVKGCAQAAFHLGYCFEEGLGISKSESKAAYWYKKGALGGDAASQANWGLCLIQKNPTKAFQILKKSGENGNAVGLNALGYCLEVGIGVDKNVQKAMMFYGMAARQNDVNAFYNLGRCLLKADKERALCFLRKAAAQGHQEAKALLVSLVKKSSRQI